MNVDVRIDRLVFDGTTVALHERAPLQAALEAELARLVAEAGIAPALLAGGAVPHLPAATIELGGGGPAALGRQIAQSVYASLGRNGR